VRARRASRAASRVLERHAVYGSVVIDASIAVQWFAIEPRSSAVAQLLEGDQRLFAPDLMPIEAANAWWKKVRMGNMERTDLDQAIVNLLGLGIELTPSASLLGQAARLAVEVELSIYDCLYLVLARDRQAQLATDDRDLRRAAARLSIPVWEP